MAGLITTTGSGNWSSTTPDAPWPSGTKPATGDWVEIAAGHTVTLDENTATLGAAGIKNVAGSNTSVLDISGTRTINGNVSHSGTATGGFITVGTGDALTILGQVSNTAAGYAIVGSGSGALTITNTGGTAITASNGRGVSWDSTGALTVTGALISTGGQAIRGTTTAVVSIDNTGGNAVQSSSSYALYWSGATTSGTITGNAYKTGGNTPAYLAGGTWTFDGLPIEAQTTGVVTMSPIQIVGATVTWVGTRTLEAAVNYAIAVESGTLVLANGSTALACANSGNLIIRKSGGTITTTAAGGTASIVNQSAAACAAIIGDGAVSIISGPTLPTAAQTVRTGTASYGYAGALYDGTFYPPNSGDSPYTEDTDAVLAGWFYGVANATEGTGSGGGGYTYGSETAGEVLTTADSGNGGGTYVAPVVGQVLAPAQGGTAYGAASGTSGTLTLANTQYVLTSAADYGIAGTGGAKTATLPTASNVLTGTGAYGVNGSGSTPSYSPDFPSVGNVTTTDTVNGSAGTLDMSLYTLITGVAAAGDVRNGTPRYTGGGNGSCYVPTAANVRFGVNVDATTGTCNVPSAAQTQVGVSVDVSDTGTFTHTEDYTLTTDIDYPQVGNVLSTDTVGDVDGTLTLPAASNVLTGSGAYGVAGTGSTPSYDPTILYQLKTDSVLISAISDTIVKDGTDITATSGTTHVTGTYSPGGTYAQGQAAQYATDQNEVTTKTAYLDNTQTICGIAGTFNLTAYGTAVSQAQIEADADTLAANVDEMLTTNEGIVASFGEAARGTYHEATTGEVQDGVHFGPTSAYVGTFVGTGGGETVVKFFGVKAK